MNLTYTWDGDTLTIKNPENEKYDIDIFIYLEPGDPEIDICIGIGMDIDESGQEHVVGKEGNNLLLQIPEAAVNHLKYLQGVMGMLYTFFEELGLVMESYEECIYASEGDHNLHIYLTNDSELKLIEFVKGLEGTNEQD